MPTERQEQVLDGVKELIDGLPLMLPTEASAALRAAPNSAAPIICIGGRGAVNQVAAALMAQQLVLEGIAAETGNEQGIPALASPVDGKRPAPLVCLTYVGEVRTAQARYNIRRIRRQFSKAPILIGLWQIPPDHLELRSVKETSGADLVAMSLREAVGLCRQHTIEATTLASELDRKSARQIGQASSSAPGGEPGLLPQEA